MDATEIRQLERTARWRSRDQARWWLRHGGYDAIQEDYRNDRLFWLAEALVEDGLGVNMVNVRWASTNGYGEERAYAWKAVELRERLHAALRGMTCQQIDALAMRVAYSADEERQG